MKTLHYVFGSLNLDALRFRHLRHAPTQSPRDKWPTRGGLFLAAALAAVFWLTLTSALAAPVATCPQDQTVECPGPIPPGATTPEDFINQGGTISGGQPPYTVTWNVTGENAAPACGNSVSCLVDSAANNYCAGINVQANVDDSFALCLPKDSETEVVTKQTTVTATNN